jgi:hypothetical protein
LAGVYMYIHLRQSGRRHGRGTQGHGHGQLHGRRAMGNIMARHDPSISSIQPVIPGMSMSIDGTLLLLLFGLAKEKRPLYLRHIDTDSIQSPYHVVVGRRPWPDPSFIPMWRCHLLVHAVHSDAPPVPVRTVRLRLRVHKSVYLRQAPLCLGRRFLAPCSPALCYLDLRPWWVPAIWTTWIHGIQDLSDAAAIPCGLAVHVSRSRSRWRSSSWSRTHHSLARLTYAPLPLTCVMRTAPTIPCDALPGSRHSCISAHTSVRVLLFAHSDFVVEPCAKTRTRR